VKYWFDTEFYEDGKRIHLISIGIVAEDGREFYAESSDFVWEWFVPEGHWLWDNVKPHLEGGPVGQVVRHPKVIAKLVKEFITKDGTELDNELWGYYAAYDHVVLAQLFGRMVDMPQGIPWFTQDIRQIKAMLENEGWEYSFPEPEGLEHHALADARWNKIAYDFIMKFAHEGDGW
jgi:hypothetical protein